MVKHGALVLSADTTKVTQEPTAVGHHMGESNLLERKGKEIFCLLWDLWQWYIVKCPNSPSIKLVRLNNIELNKVKILVTFESPPPPRTLTITSMTVSCIPRALIRLGCW